MRCVVLMLMLTGCAGLRWVPLPPEAEVHRAKTADGWGIALVRYQAIGPSTGRPVVLVHGISANARNMDLDEQHSLARWLAAHGREAWTVSLRGAGDSDDADPDQGRERGFTFDSYWQQDLPAVIDEVRRVSGADSVDYIGHSMGGLVAYAYLAEGGKGIHAAVTMGSPTRLDWGTGAEGPLNAAAKIVPRSWMIPSSVGGHALVELMGIVDDGPFQRFFYVPENTTLLSWKRLVAYGTANISGGVAAQLGAGALNGSFMSADLTRDFRKDLGTVTTPVLVIAARRDHIAITPAVYDGYRALGGPREWLLISRANGAQAEYGHMDLVIGEHAATEVWTPALEFFNRHAK